MSSYIRTLKGFMAKDKKGKEASWRLAEIENLKQRLVQAGYQPAEAEYFMQREAGDEDLNSLNNTQLDQVITQLKEQLQIAEKCRNMFK